MLEVNGIGMEMVVVLLFCIAMYYDHRYYRVPNWVVFTGFALGLLKQIDLYGWKGIFIYSISIILTGLILSPLFLLRMFGAGDIKLFIMVSGMHGIQFSIKYFVIALFIGAIYSVGKMLRHRNLVSRLRYLASYFYIVVAGRSVQIYEVDREDESTIIPFAVPMGIAYVIGIIAENKKG